MLDIKVDVYRVMDAVAGTESHISKPSTYIAYNSLNNEGPNRPENDALGVRVASCVYGVDGDAHEEHQCREDCSSDKVVIQDPERK